MVGQVVLEVTVGKLLVTADQKVSTRPDHLQRERKLLAVEHKCLSILPEILLSMVAPILCFNDLILRMLRRNGQLYHCLNRLVLVSLDRVALLTNLALQLRHGFP